MSRPDPNVRGSEGGLRADIPHVLASSAVPLCDAYDLAIVDLDGTVYVGRDVVPGAAEVLARLTTTRMHAAFVTNNAARTPEQVARTLNRMGIEAGPEDIVTSAQAAAACLRAMLPVASPVLVVGGRGLNEALEAQGLIPVTSVLDDPQAVVQGWTPELDWRMLAEGAYALQRGIPWVAANTDLTVPTSRGIAPGNGSFVALLGRVVGREPDVVAGKPGVALLEQTARRYRASRPLVVGDRLDTDIAGATAAGMDSLLVLTGVTTWTDLIVATADRRPSYVGGDLSAVLSEHPSTHILAGRYQVGDYGVTLDRAQGVATVELATPNPVQEQGDLDLARAAAAAGWEAVDEGLSVRTTRRLEAAMLRPPPPERVSR